jgi:cysteine-rich repeat protein
MRLPEKEKNMMTEEIHLQRRYAHRLIVLTTMSLGPSACYSPADVDPKEDGITSSESSSGQTPHAETTGGPSEPMLTTTDTADTKDITTTTSIMDSTTDAESTTGEAPVCGNARIEDGEVCDDGVNDGSYGGCSVDCQSLAPRCGDDSVDTPEACDDANEDSTDGCLSDCSVPASCMAIQQHDPTAVSGVHEIDSDGPGGYGAHDAYCDMDHAGGGWTLVIVSADDGHATWSWLGRELMTTDTFLVGNVAVLDEDYKSPALHLAEFSDLLFVHEPSGVWASYEGVGDGTSDVGTFMSGLPFPQCDLASGFPMTDGELTQIGTNLCNTDLYFHTGDHDGALGQAYCEAFTGVNYNATYGPVWNAANNGGCSMDDPSLSALGPSRMATYDVQPPPPGIEDVEQDSRGFATPMGLAQPSDRLEMYVR